MRSRSRLTSVLEEAAYSLSGFAVIFVTAVVVVFLSSQRWYKLVNCPLLHLIDVVAMVDIQTDKVALLS